MLSKRLKMIRKAKGLTQDDLAKLVNTKKTTISNYETGYSTPSNEMLKDLANLLGTTTDWLLGRSDSPVEYNKDEKQLLIDLSLSDKELFKKYKFAFGDKEYSEEEAKALLSILRSVQVLRK